MAGGAVMTVFYRASGVTRQEMLPFAVQRLSGFPSDAASQLSLEVVMILQTDP
jgi:hypothetical protein